MKSLFVVATGQYVGKTTLSLGLMGLMKSRGLRVQFFKPIGQQYVELQGHKIDKDAVLMQSALRLQGELTKMSPVAVPRGFTEEYLSHRDVEPLKKRIRDAYDQLCNHCDVVVIEGTGHAGVGSCFDLSNADVASMLDARALLVAEGGIGSTLDQVALNISLFRDRKVKVLGVIANKVFPDKRERIEQALAQGLSNMGLPLLGVVPYEASLTYPRVRQVAGMLEAEVLCGHQALESRIENVLVAAMEPQNVLPRIGHASLMITAGDRIDNILLALNTKLLPAEVRGSVVGLVLTGGFIPHFAIISLIKRSGLPVMLCKENTYGVATKVHQMVCRILPEDKDKIEQVQHLVKTYVKLDQILDGLSGE